MINTTDVTLEKPVSAQKSIGRYLLLAVLLIIAILAVTLFSFLRYQPALRAGPGYTVQNATEPGWLNGRFKRRRHPSRRHNPAGTTAIRATRRFDR